MKKPTGNKIGTIVEPLSEVEIIEGGKIVGMRVFYVHKQKPITKFYGSKQKANKFLIKALDFLNNTNVME